jgi:uncharacterized membrane protein required for colicin V production
MYELLITPLPSYAYTLIGIGFVAIFVVRGYRRGVIREGLGILSLLLSIPLSHPFGVVLRPWLPLDNAPSIVHALIATSFGGLIAYTLLQVLFFLMKKWIFRHWKPQGRVHMFIGVGGALIGGIFAVLIVLFISWYILVMGKLSQAAVRANTLKTPTGAETQHKRSLLMLPAEMVGAHTEGLQKSALGEIAEETNPVPHNVNTSIDIASAMLADPTKMQKLARNASFSALLNHDSVQDVLHNPDIQKLVAAGDLFGIINHPAITVMMNDPALQESMKTIDVDQLMRSLNEEE